MSNISTTTFKKKSDPLEWSSYNLRCLEKEIKYILAASTISQIYLLIAQGRAYNLLLFYFY